MRKYSIIPMAALMVLAAACAKNEEDVVLGQNQEVVPASDAVCIHAVGGESNDPAVKSEIDGTSGAFTWSAGDQIAVYSSTAGYKKSDALTTDTGAGSNAATFYFSGSNTFDLSTRADVAVFPASLVYNGSTVRPNSATDHTVGEGGKLTITLPQSYKFSACRNNTIATPMVAVNTPGGSLAFKSICALVRITVKNIPKDTHTIRISFPGKKVCGEFTINNLAVGTDGLLLSDSEAEGDDTIIVTDLYVSAFNSSGLELNVPVPVGVAGDQEYLYVRAAAYDYFQNETTSEVFEHKINSIDTPLKVVESVPTAWAPGRLAAKKVTANLPYFTSCNKSPYRRVVFAPGNLQVTTTRIPTNRAASGSKIYQAYGEVNPQSWRFAAHQWEAYRNTTSNNLKAVGDVDLFAWVGTSASYADYTETTKYGIVYVDVSQKTSLLGNISASEVIKPESDWSNIFNGVTYAAGTWRLPDKAGNTALGDSSPEWTRLLNQRPNASGSGKGIVAAKATIIKGNGTDVPDTLSRGLIVFPDVYTHPYGVKTLINYAREDATAGQSAKKYSNNIITEEEWDLLEKVGGCVFLPVTHIRDRVKVNGTYKESTDIYKDAAYWSNYTVSGSNVATVIISDAEYSAHSRDGGDAAVDPSNNPKAAKTNINPAKSVDRSRGCAVRLVRDVN